jgi:hypothetical protein
VHKKRGGVLTNEKFEQLAAGGGGVTRALNLWRTFWGFADEVRGHYLWRGPVKHGRPVFIPERGPALPATHVAWIHRRLELGADEDPRPTCGRKLCIRPDHQEVEAVRGSR